MAAKPLFWVFITAALIAGGIAWVVFSSTPTVALGDEEMVIYKSLNCGCCGVYANYAERYGANVQVVNTEMSAIRERYGVPAALQSCHTSIIGGYFVEGHVPVEAVAKLLKEKPDIAGLAMPGMPSGSPGMPGSKEGPFIIYAVQRDGTSAEYLRI